MRGVALLIQKLACGIHDINGLFLLTPMDSAFRSQLCRRKCPKGNTF